MAVLQRRRCWKPWVSGAHLSLGLVVASGLWALRLVISIDGGSLERGFGDEVLEIGGLLLLASTMAALLRTCPPAPAAATDGG